MKYVGLDIETTGLYPIKGQDKIYCVAVNDGKKITVYTDVEKIRALCEDEKVCKVIHNAAFDSFWLKQLHGITVRNIWDTRLMEQILIGENLPRSEKNEALKAVLSSSLVYTLARYKFPSYDKSFGAKFASRNPAALLTKEEIEYVKNDVRYLPQLQSLQFLRLARLDLMRVATLENSCVEVVVEMRARGIGLDVERWKDIARTNELELNKKLRRLPASVDNWNSPKQVKEYFQRKGIPVESLTDIEELKDIYNDEVLNNFIEMRSLVKSVSTYGLSWLEDEYKRGYTFDKDMRIRADFEQILNTGRFSCSHPNLQQLPRNGLHRSAFVPRKGYVFVVGDFSGQELGIMAAASKEELWIKAMLRKEDVHSLTASLLYPDWFQVKDKGCTFPLKCSCRAHKAYRENAKTINFAIAYGAGPQKIGKNLKLTMNEASKLLNKYKRVVPKLIRWLGRNADSTIKTRLSFSADPYKRRRTCRDPEEWMLKNVGKNNPVQSCGANMIKLAMISMPNAPLVLTIHDELILECKASEAKKWSKVLKGTMEKAATYCTGIEGLIQVTPSVVKSLQK